MKNHPKNRKFFAVAPIFYFVSFSTEFAKNLLVASCDKQIFISNSLADLIIIRAEGELSYDRRESKNKFLRI